MKRTIALTLLVLLLAFLLAQTVHAQGPVTPPPPPVVTPPPVDPLVTAKQIDEANARADQWQQVAVNAAASAQASINNAYASLYAAQAGVNQMQIALQQSEAARIAAQQGQIQQAVAAAQNAQLAGVQAVSLASASGQSAMLSLKQSSDALRAVSELRASLTAVTAQRNTARTDVAERDQTIIQRDKDLAAVASALMMERQRSDLYLKVAVSFFLLLGLLMSYIALLLWKVMRTLRPAGRDRMVVMNERGEVKARIEALS
jgi:hypothetical protein